ncbi:hypothetical protein ACQPZP_04495 [Spirillospora sp. CA-142024]|uniref:hypothetical protein n=1 Tax=Spirillospora sp. CA-142024 TaxID=3240036 RepID=UPI003D8A9B91
MVLRGDLVDEIRRLKELLGKELQFPVVVGTGKRLFPDGSTPATFATVEERSRVLPGGVVSLTLNPANLGAISAGAYIVDEGRSATVLA